MRVLIATDAWHPQVNGVVNTYANIAREAGPAGLDLAFITPDLFYSVPMPTYNEIPLSLITPRQARKRIEVQRPEYVHIATEGPIGLATRAYCVSAGRKFTTSYHTRFPEYAAARFPVPVSWGYRFERWFHNAGAGVMAASASMCEELSRHGILNAHLWSRGVDLELFRPRSCRRFDGQRPIFLYVGRVAVEKNIEAFLALDLPGTKAVVGDGPQLDALRRKYSDAIFTGAKSGVDLAEHYASADVFVFPSLTDTFGNVILEALASGVPVAAFPVTGPKDVVTPATGVMRDSLKDAALGALSLDRAGCRSYAETFSWAECARRFADIVKTANGTV